MTGVRTDPASSARGQGATWFVYANGVPRDAGYQWFAITAGADPAVAGDAYYRAVGGCEPNQYAGDSEPSILFGRDEQAGWRLFVGGLKPAAAPVGRFRSITAVLFGVTPPGADPAPLLDAVDRALAGVLDAELPVRWDDGQRPQIDPDRPWKDRPGGIAPPSDTMPPTTAGYAVGGPADGAFVERVRADLASLDPAALDAFPADRPLVLRHSLLDSEQFRRIKPWRGIGGAITESIAIERRPKAATSKDDKPKESKRRPGPAVDADRHPFRTGDGESGTAAGGGIAAAPDSDTAGSVGFGGRGTLGRARGAIRACIIGGALVAAAAAVVIIVVSRGGQAAVSNPAASPRPRPSPSPARTAPLQSATATVRATPASTVKATPTSTVKATSAAGEGRRSTTAVPSATGHR